LTTLNNTYLQYQGFIETKSIFTSENLFLKQELFECNYKDISSSFDLIIKENLMLGKRAESFFKHQITREATFDILAENIQLFKEKRTVGEIDFILQEKTSLQPTHIELTYKFYLYNPKINGHEIDRWIGPNQKDSLLQKINKFNTHQFPLLHSEYAKSLLNNLNLTPKGIKQKACFKAQLFVPHSLKNEVFPFINQQAIQGVYFNLKDFLESDLIPHQFCIPQKKDWLISPKNNISWYSYTSIEKEIIENLKQQKSPLLWVKKNTDTFESIFITWW